MDASTLSAFTSAASLTRTSLFGRAVRVRGQALTVAVTTPVVGMELDLGGVEQKTALIMRVPIADWPGQSEPEVWERVEIGSENYSVTGFTRDLLHNEYVVKLASTTAP